MTRAQLIDGKVIALELRKKIREETAALIKQHDVKPGLAVVLVGEDPASSVYVRNKGIATKKAGMESFTHQLPADTSERDLLQLVAQLNQDASVHGILVQLPLPKQIDTDKVLQAIDPDKDVDGFHPINAGRLMTGQPGHVPCTPKGCVMLAKSVLPDLTGLEAVVVGRSNIVGKPVAQLLLNENCTVTIAHSRTKDLASVIQRADLLIAAVGLPEFIRGDWIKPGACIIDVGINRIDLEDSKTRLVGDVAFNEAVAVAGSITPVPGGVGPMTIAMLLVNTLDAAKRQIR
ncbi:MAG: bifunctional methylenetetrahydrofolate dehydrogenase/methenyltetrahydrofolate cyclohydrolase FolD [bacterium]|nr:bifunctional methylenetetrahydrofolate dehydrogenase/methenyltetrahydrofolate cyclohydrolase FolD [bacterium]